MLKSVVHKYANEPVLVLGGVGDAVRKVAERYVRQLTIVVPSYLAFYSYGFKRAYTSLDVLAWNPAHVFYIWWPIRDAHSFAPVVYGPYTNFLMRNSRVRRCQ